MYYGVQYYPEQWPEDRWPTDAEMMQRAGVNTVRMGEFAWSALEPREGEIDFSWMDRAVQLLNDHGIKGDHVHLLAHPAAVGIQKYPGVVNVRKTGGPTCTGSAIQSGWRTPNLSRWPSALTGRWWSITPGTRASPAGRWITKSAASTTASATAAWATFHQYLQREIRHG
jgi:beta-galactosidase GanA